MKIIMLHMAAQLPTPQQNDEVFRRLNAFIQGNGVLQTVQRTFQNMTEEQIGKMTVAEYMSVISKAAGDFLLQTVPQAQRPHNQHDDGTPFDRLMHQGNGMED